MLTTVQTVEFVYVRNAFKCFILLPLVCSQASSQSLKTYSLGVLFLNEVMCNDKASGLLFDLHSCKDICLFHYLDAMEVVPGFAVSCHHCCEVWSYVNFHFKPVLLTLRLLMTYIYGAPSKARNIVQQIERDCFSVAKRRSIYIRR